MRLKRTEQLTVLTVSILIMVSIATVYIRHHDVDIKKQLCRSYAIASFQTQKHCKESDCESLSSLFEPITKDADFRSILLELEKPFFDSEAFQNALETCEKID